MKAIWLQGRDAYPQGDAVAQAIEALRVVDDAQDAAARMIEDD